MITVPAQPRRGSLMVVGVGITGVGQTTLEAEACIERADPCALSRARANDGAVDSTDQRERRHAWRLLSGRPEPEGNLRGDDRAHRRRGAQRASRLRRVLWPPRRAGEVVARGDRDLEEGRVSGADAARRLGGWLPFADLGFNPGDFGVQTFEATDFLRARRRFDPTSGLILWQVGVLGEVDSRSGVMPPRASGEVDRRTRPSTIRRPTRSSSITRRCSRPIRRSSSG